MLQAMNTGHDGSLTTMHANSPEDALARIETMVLMAGNDLPSRAIREQIGAAIHVIVHQVRLRDGSRKINHISEVRGFNPETQRVEVSTIFQYEQLGVREDGRVMGRLGPTGVIPHHLEDLRAAGQEVDVAMFDPSDPGRVVEYNLEGSVADA
jgi:pilus assembly protein CpaF